MRISDWSSDVCSSDLMAIIIRRNKKTARIMRQEYVRKDSEGNAHGFVRQVPLATISLSATEVPGDIAKLLSTKELGRLERAVVIPARATAAIGRAHV